MHPQNERLNPKKSAHNYYMLNRLKCIIEEMIGKYVERREGKQKLIDYGCGDIPYFPLFKGKVANYVACDIENNPLAEVIITSEGKVPLPNESFDIVLSVQVLEHVDDVGNYLAEAKRLLGEEGLLLLSTHGQWVWHPCPKDLWRWTKEGLAYTLEKSGFDIVEILWASGLLAYSAQLRLFYLRSLSQHNGFIFKSILKLASYVSNQLMPFMDKLEARSGNFNAAVYFVVARKKRT